jgi:hypothetical protein
VLQYVKLEDLKKTVDGKKRKIIEAENAVYIIVFSVL